MGFGGTVAMLLAAHAQQPERWHLNQMTVLS